MHDAYLPCPFCGARAERKAAATEGYVVVQCYGCDVRTNEVWMHEADLDERLATLWNKRAGGKAISLGLLASLADKLSRNHSKAVSALDRAKRKVKHKDILELAGYQGDPDADLVECTALEDAYGDALQMVRALQDVVREHNDDVP